MVRHKESIKFRRICSERVHSHTVKKWDECLPLAEFAYNNSYQESIRMAPFEALYGRRCRTPLNWSEAGERNFFGPDIVGEAEEQV